MLRALILGAIVALVAACGNGGADEIHDISTLPNRVSVCGRTWIRDSLLRQRTAAEIRDQSGVEPAVVGTDLFQACPAGVCTTVAQGKPCQVVVYVRVGEDAYIDYELSGGP